MTPRPLPPVLRLLRAHPLLVVMAVLGAAGALAFTTREAGRRTHAMATAGKATREAVASARAAAASRWAPAELTAAETAWREASIRQRIEETRWWPFRDADGVIRAHATAQDLARRAADASHLRRAAAAQTTEAAMRVASAAVTSTESLASAIHPGRDRLMLLSRARSALREAGVYAREGDLLAAEARAREATELTARVRDHAAEVASRYADRDTLARWRQWIDETVAWSRREGRPAIVVSKEAHTLTLYDRGQRVRTYRVELGPNWIADKGRAGDDATPEGRYRVVARRSGGASIYYKALLLDYPNAADRARFAAARRSGALPSSAAIGGLIEIHGEGGRGRDWTQGCVALTNPDIDELFARVSVGTPVTIVGSDNHGAIADFAVQHRGASARRP